ncbi:hypothetical protein AALO_G00158390 [Alosa alosa]|uniref:RING-type domain-containing protein n=1 Tax=Alosa alosa TaxID=278164 RepID=A0AAV6GHL7_9TELE|nr:fatty acid 2-hydroxylase-like isoform X1 [Alosa alosa]KAG5274029.1 hypothetical protein AALO_G00158390 [Alosa alosa]
MAEQQLRNTLMDFLCCNVCGGTLKNPVSLGCNHSFCQICLSDFWKEQIDEKCPLCKRKSSKNRLINFSLKELADCYDATTQRHNVEDEQSDECPNPTIQPGHPKLQQMLRKRSTKEEGLTRPGRVELDEDLVDWNKPLAWQVGHLGSKYDKWVHKPVDRPIRLFESEFLEARTKAAWYWVPICWVPVVICLTLYCWTLLSKSDNSVPIHKYGVPLVLTLGGLFLWLFLTYWIHFLFHTPLKRNYYMITIHFILHGQHHKNPNDNSRLVFPPSLAFLLMGILYWALSWLLPEVLALSLLLGVICGYVLNDLVHYYLHHGSPSEGSWFYFIRNSHIKHHFENPDKGLGITTTVFDSLFETDIPQMH